MSEQHDAFLKAEKMLIEYINLTPDLLPLLYDLDLLPEQLEPKTKDRFRMLILATWHESHFRSK